MNMFSRHKTYFNNWVSRTGHSRKVKSNGNSIWFEIWILMLIVNPNWSWKCHRNSAVSFILFSMYLIGVINKSLSFSPQCLLRLWGSCLALVCSSFLWLYSFFTSITNYPLRVPNNCPALTSTERARSQQVCHCFSAIVCVWYPVQWPLYLDTWAIFIIYNELNTLLCKHLRTIILKKQCFLSIVTEKIYIMQFIMLNI